MNKISVYILAYNEAAKIEAAIHSVLWADEIIVIDSDSQDSTVEIASRLGARVVQLTFQGFGELRNQAIANCQHEWILSLDADERCTSMVRDEILQLINTDNSQDIYYIPRKNYFMGRWIKHCGWYPNYRQPQLFRKGTLAYTSEPVHEGFIAHSNRIGYLKAAIWQVPFKNLEEVIAKMNRYSSLGVEKLQQKHYQSSMGKAVIHGMWSFIKHYFFKRGFLDGWAGFIISLGNFEGTFYRYAKLYEQQQDWQLPTQSPLKRE